MKVVIRNLSQKALKELDEDLGPAKFWIDEVSPNGLDQNVFDVTLAEGVMIKTHFDSLTIDRGNHIAILNEDEFEKVVIV